MTAELLTVIFPVEEFIANALLLFPAVMLYVRVCPWSGSVAVMVPTSKPLGEFSGIEKVLFAITGGSFTSVMFMVAVAVVEATGVPLS